MSYRRLRLSHQRRTENTAAIASQKTPLIKNASETVMVALRPWGLELYRAENDLAVGSTQWRAR